MAIFGAVPSRFFPITSVSDFKVPITLVGTFFFVVHPILSLYLETIQASVSDAVSEVVCMLQHDPSHSSRWDGQMVTRDFLKLVA